MHGLHACHAKFRPDILLNLWSYKICYPNLAFPHKARCRSGGATSVLAWFSPQRFARHLTAEQGGFVVIIRTIARAGAMLALALTAPVWAQDPKLPRQKIDPVAPPFAHPHEQATRQGPKIIEVTLVAEEKEIVIDDEGTKLQAMTFNGSIPAPLIVVHEGDYVEVTLISAATNTMPHNIDFHSATGASGGGDLTLINPGEQAVMRWKATRTGVFVYHCIPGGPMIPWHIASGMSGAVMVLPRDGLRDGAGKPLKYDRVYYIGENDFYVPRDSAGKFKSYDSHGDAFADTLELMRKLVPTHVVFNGRV